MRIGIDISQTGKTKAGCGYVAYSLVNALAQMDSQNEYILYPTFGDVYLDPDWKISTLRVDRPNFQPGIGHRNLEGAQPFWRNPPPDFEAQLGHPDVVMANNFYCPTGLKKSRLIYLLHDLSYLTNPDWTTEANRTACFSGAFNASIYADFIITPSQYTLDQLHQIYPHFPLERAIFIPLASRFEGLAEPEPTPAVAPLKPGQFWLNVGTLEPRKNQVRLLRAYAELKSRHADALPLVLAGGKGWLLDHFEGLVQELGLGQSVRLMGYVDDASLQWLYHNCYAFLEPSLLEGFGLPVLEAMSQGAAVITSNVTSLPEVIGSAGIQVDPYSESDILNAMERLAGDQTLRLDLKTRAAERARQFSWEGFARRTLEVFEKALAASKRL